MKTNHSCYLVCIKQTASEENTNGLLTIRDFDSLYHAISYANEWLGATPVSVTPFCNGFRFSVTDRDAVEQADGGVDYITIRLINRSQP